MKKVLMSVLAVVFCLSSAFAASNKPDTLKVALSLKSDKAVMDAIIKGCESRGWVPSKSGDSEITATLDNRGHHVAVKISYSGSGYEIIYKDSTNMKYNAKNNTIHPKYNTWTHNLNKSIKASIDYQSEMK
jgi:hypothetical protein